MLLLAARTSPVGIAGSRTERKIPVVTPEAPSLNQATETDESVLEPVPKAEVTALQKFGELLYADLSPKPFGSISKGELELAYFSALVDSDLLDLDKLDDFGIARSLQCTTAKANNLRFSYQIRFTQSRTVEELRADLADKVVFVDVTDPKENTKDKSKSKSSQIIFNVDHKFWRSFFIAELKAAGITYDTSFNRERVIVSTKTFAEKAHRVFAIDPGAVEEIYLDDDGEEANNKRRKVLREAIQNISNGAYSKIGSEATVFVLGTVLGLIHAGSGI